MINARLKLLLICNLSRQKVNSHRGFALPMALMVGMVILVVGVTMIIRAQGDQSKVISQKTKMASMAAAETGLTRIQNMFAGARFAALYNDTDLASAIASDGTPSTTKPDGTTNNTGVTLNTQLTAVANSNSSACGTSDAATKTTTIKAQLAQLRTLAAATTNPGTYQPIDTKNSYRLVSYKYAGTSGALPGSGVTATGRIVIEGKSAEGGSESVSRIMVDIPISGAATAALPGGTLAPGLWIKQQGVNDASKSESTLDMSSGALNANVVLNDCTNAISDSYVSALNTTQVARGYGASRSSVAMPAAPAIPTGVTPYALTSSASLPRSGEIAAADGYYYYQRTGDLSDITVDHTGGKKYRIYFSGNIPKTSSINSNCDSTSGCQPTDLQLFGTGTSGEICMNGNSDRQVAAFVLAPNYALGKTGNGNFLGSYIVKTWGKIASCGSNNGKLAIIQTQAWGNVPSELRPGSVPLPTIAAFSSWQQMDITASVPAPPSPVTVAGGGNTVSTTNGAMCTVPTLEEKSTTGLTATTLLAYVQSTLTAAKLTGTATGTADSSGATETILTQSPAAGSSVNCSTPVTYTYKLPVVCSITAPASRVFTKNGGSGNITVTYANATNLTISATASGGTISPASSTGLSGSGSTIFSVSYGNGNASGSVSFSSSCGSGTTSFTTN